MTRRRSEMLRELTALTEEIEAYDVAIGDIEQRRARVHPCSKEWDCLMSDEHVIASSKRAAEMLARETEVELGYKRNNGG